MRHRQGATSWQVRVEARRSRVWQVYPKVTLVKDVEYIFEEPTASPAPATIIIVVIVLAPVSITVRIPIIVLARSQYVSRLRESWWRGRLWHTRSWGVPKLSDPIYDLIEFIFIEPNTAACSTKINLNALAVSHGQFNNLTSWTSHRWDSKRILDREGFFWNFSPGKVINGR